MMLDAFGVTEETWRDAHDELPARTCAISETPRYVGRAVAALAADPDVAPLERRVALERASSLQEYGFTDLDGAQPGRWRYMVEVQDARQAGRRHRLPLGRWR